MSVTANEFYSLLCCFGGYLKENLKETFTCRDVLRTLSNIYDGAFCENS